MKRLNKTLLTILLIILSLGANAQEKVAMADGMRAEGKIYVVVAIIMVILVGFIAYLFLLDRKISKLENQLRQYTDKTK